MNEYSLASENKLKQCDRRLQEVFRAVLRIIDHTILEGYRDQIAQDQAFAEGKSQKKWPDGKHNQLPSLAVDAAPYPIDWQNTKRFYYFAGLVLGTAFMMGIQIRYGGDWNQNQNLEDESFRDLVHFEIVDT